MPAHRIAVRGASEKKTGSPLRAATPETPRMHAEAKRGVATATDKAGCEWNPSGATEVTPIWYSGLAAEKCVALSIILSVGFIHANARRIAARHGVHRRSVTCHRRYVAPVNTQDVSTIYSLTKQDACQ